ncbi:MAG: hypothetical protein S4CHLAM7_04520 [Chlamydiae bacterium]|nr:hypothetical protein [Chlamydiota bacterium]
MKFEERAQMLQRFLGIHPEERKNLLLFSILAICWSIASSSGVALSDTFFLKYVGSQELSHTFAYTAAGMFFMSGILVYLYNRLEIDQIFFRALLLGAAFYTASFCSMLIGVTAPLFWIIFKVFCYFFQVAFISLFFTFLEQFFELQNAKRLFSVLYSPIFLGMAVSGAILPLSNTTTGTLSILILILISLSASLFLLKYIASSIEKIPDDHQEFTVFKTSKKDLFKAIITSKFTFLFLLCSIVLHSVLVITEFQYMSGLELSFQNKTPEQLTEFLGRLYFWGSLVNILFGVLFYGRLVKKVGLNNIILIVPLFFTTLFAGWMFSSHIFLPVMGFIAVEGVLNLLEDNNFTLLLNAVPLKLKNKIRVTCESIFEPLGMLISSFLLLIFQAQSKLLGLTLSLIFLVSTCLMRAYYTKGIFYNLISHLIPFQSSRVLKSMISKREYKQSRALFLNQFHEMQEGEQLFLLEYTLRFHDLKYLELIIKSMTQLSMRIKLKTWELFENYPSGYTSKFLTYFEDWIQTEPTLENDFFLHLSKMKLLDVKVAQENLSHFCPKIKGASLLAVRQRLPHSPESKVARKILYSLLVSKNEMDNLIGIQILKYERLKDFKSKVFDLLTSSSFKLKKYILKTLPYLLDKDDTQYAPILLKCLQNEEYVSMRLWVLGALEKIADVFLIRELLIISYHFTLQEKRYLHQIIKNMGSVALPELESIFQNTHLPDPIRLIAAQILGKISHRHLKIFFHKIVTTEVERAYFYLYHFKTIEKSFPKHPLPLLTSALKNSFDSVFKFIIESLALINRFEEGEYLVKSLLSNHRKTYSHALETLDKMCSNKLYRQLKPIVEKGQDPTFLKFYQSHKYPIMPLDNLLDRLEQTPSYINQTIAPIIRKKLNLSDSFSISSRIRILDKRLNHFTSELLEINNR